jgi:hypothetical protein
MASALLAPEVEKGRQIRSALAAQLDGSQPFGIEVISFKS